MGCAEPLAFLAGSASCAEPLAFLAECASCAEPLAFKIKWGRSPALYHLSEYSFDNWRYLREVGAPSHRYKFVVNYKEDVAQHIEQYNKV